MWLLKDNVSEKSPMKNRKKGQRPLWCVTSRYNFLKSQVCFSLILEKSTVLRKLFGLKARRKKRHQSASSVTTSSGCSSASPVLSNDEDEGVVELQHDGTTQLELDSHTLTNLSAALVPFQVTCIPNNTLNDSMKVHCGNTIIQPQIEAGKKIVWFHFCANLVLRVLKAWVI